MMIRNLLLVASLACLWGCGDRDSNPIGLELVDRMQGALVSLPPLPAADTWSRFDGLFPGPGGLEPGLVVGRMSGLILRAAVRFRVPLDSLAAAAGGSGAPDLVLTDVRLHLRRLSAFERLSGSFSVERPDFAWDEGSTFIDTVNSVELDAPSTPIPGVDLVVGADSLYTFVLPTDYVQANLDSAALSLLLLPDSGEEFIATVVSRDEPEKLDLRPRLVVSYRVGNADLVHETVSTADTYWVGRDAGGLPPDALVLSDLLRFVPFLRFSIPDTIPAAATIVSTTLAVDIDGDRSLYSRLEFSVNRVDLDEATGDTLETRFSTWAFEGNADSFLLSPGLLQSWISGDIPNRGLTMSPITLFAGVEWVTLRNPRLEIIYALPPERANE